MLRKLSEKVFINKKFTQCKTSGTLKIDAVEIPDTKNIGLLFLNQPDSCSDPSQILILHFPTPDASLPPSPSVKFYSSQLKSLFNTILSMFFMSFPTLPYRIWPHATISIGYIKPCVKPSQSSVLSSYIQIIISYGSNFSFKVRQHSQQQLYLQYKVCWILCKMVGAYSFSQPHLCVQPRLRSPPKIRFSTCSQIILTIPTNTPFLYTPVILHLLIFAYNLPNNLHQKYFLLLSMSQFRLCQRTRKLGVLARNDTVLVPHLLPQSMDSDNRTHNHWLLIAQAQQIGILQVVVSDEDACNRNGKQSNPHSLIPSTYCHHFHTLLIPSQEHPFSLKSVASLDIHPKSSILIYYSCPSPLVCLEIIPS